MDLNFKPGEAPRPFRPGDAIAPFAFGDEDDTPEKDDPDEVERKRKLVAEAIERFQLAASATSVQRAQEEEDLKFDRGLPEDQWLPEMLKARRGGIQDDGSSLPSRPTLTIPRQDQPVQQVIQEARAARFAITVKPRGKGANKDGAEVRQGLYRSIEVDSRAQIARIWALERSAKCGFGAYRILKKYANDGDFDQDLVIERILNQGSVYLDPFAIQPDWSDGEWALITMDLPEKVYKQRYPTSQLGAVSAEQLTSIGDQSPGWVGGSTEARTIRVAEYFYLEHHERELVHIDDLGDLWLEEVPEGRETDIADRRMVDDRVVKWCVINAVEVLDEEDWDGRFIPIVPVIGKEYFVENRRTFQGIITKSKDAQRAYNVMRSEQTIAVGLASKSHWVMAEGQDEGYELQWDEINNRYFTRAIYKPTTFEGQLVPPPSIAVDRPDIGALTQLAREAEDDIRATTGRQAPSLGQPDGNRSGKAIRELKMQGETTTGVYADNLANISMTYEAMVVLDLMKYVYWRPGRMAKILGEDLKTERDVLLNQPFHETDDGPVPYAAPGPLGRFVSSMTGRGQAKPPLHYDLTQGDYSAVVAVGKSFQTQREEESAFMGQLAESAPQLVPLYADLWVRSYDTPVAGQIADRIKAANPALKGENEKNGKPAIPPEAMAQIQQLQQQNQQAMQAVQQLQQAVKADQVKADATYKIAVAELQSKERIAAMQMQAELMKARATLDAKQGLAVLDAQIAALSQRRDQMHEMDMAGLEQSAAAVQMQQAQAHEAGLMQLGQQHEVGMTALDQSHAREVATMPPPAAPAPEQPAPVDGGDGQL